MAVYFAPPKQNNLSTLGIIDLLGKYIVNPMMERSADARKVEQARQLESDKRAYQQGLMDRLVAGANQNLPAGVGDALAAIIGLGGNPQQAQDYFMPKPLEVDYGDRKTVYRRSPFDTTDITGQVGMSPKDAGGLELDKGKLALEDWYKKQQIANERARTGIMAQNANREQWGMMPGYTDENGNPVYINPQTGATRGVAGVKPIQVPRDPLDVYQKLATIIGLLSKGGGGDSLLGGSGGGVSPGVIDMVIKSLLNEVGIGPQPAPAPAPNPGKSPGTLTMADIDAKAKAHGMTREAVLADAQKQGYQIIK
jgi:hypothetical protein